MDIVMGTAFSFVPKEYHLLISQFFLKHIRCYEAFDATFQDENGLAAHAISFIIG